MSDNKISIKELVRKAGTQQMQGVEATRGLLAGAAVPQVALERW